MKLIDFASFGKKVARVMLKLYCCLVRSAKYGYREALIELV